MHLLIARYPGFALVVSMVFLISAGIMEFTDVRSAVEDYRMTKLSLHRAGYCPRSTMAGCAVVLPDEKPDKVIKELKGQRARRIALKRLQAFHDQT